MEEKINCSVFIIIIITLFMHIKHVLDLLFANLEIDLSYFYLTSWISF